MSLSELGGGKQARPKQLGGREQPFRGILFRPRLTLIGDGERFATPRLQEGTGDPTPNSLIPIVQPHPAQLEPQYNQLFQEHTEQLAQEANAIGPDRELTDQAEWRQWLEKNIEGFAGNLDNAATLMAALTEGKSYIYEKLTGRGLKSFARPDTVILFQDDASTSVISEGNMGQNILVKQPYLEKLSNYDMYAMVTITRQDGAVTYQGTLPDMMSLAGVEETHHTAFKQKKKDIVPGIDPLSTTVAEYDAREAEYRALKWQVRYAEERHMPDETINLLKERLDAATAVRAKKQK